ncbi:Wzz/FepE/Etk N-terminal domain-containing protein [Deinococcus malanensis]|uniref:Wzz/FepE/Etk N-terminal domain-containing protein n=1 Tax=Deinococcus malanensis TaxID=1706855 RepID=UPI0036343354
MTERAESREIDLSVLWLGLRRRLAWILGTALLLALAAFLWSRSQPRVYEASASLIASNSQGQDSTLSTALVKAPPLPEGAVAQALQSTQVIGPLIQAIRKEEEISQSERERLSENLGRN